MHTPRHQSMIRAICTAALACLAAACAPEDPGTYLPGGRNIEAASYARDDEHPAFSDRAEFLGTLRGDWREIGRELGRRAGESSRWVSDAWWKQTCEMWGLEETLRAFELYEAQIAALDPGLLELMRGIADGSEPWLAASRFADEGDPLHATAYQRVLAVNLWDAWSMMHPREFPNGTTTFGGTVDGPPVLPHMTGCSAFAARGAATSHSEVILAHNRHSPYHPRCYEQVYVLEPTGGHACWVLSNSPQLTGNQIVNEHGVSIALLAGGITNPRSLAHDGGPYVAEAFGVPWFHLFVWIGTHARSAEEAIEMLTRGTEAYRDRAVRESLLRCGGWNFLVADAETLAVVEATADRYAVRRAGDELPFTGPGWRNEDYIVATNHFIADFSHDAENRRTSVPMTIFNDGWVRDAESGDPLELTESGVRFWTLMWDLRHNLGRVDRFRAQQILSGLYAHDRETGRRIEVAQADDGTWQLFGRARYCTAGRASLGAGTCDGKIAIMDGREVSVSWTLGSPIHWQGAWDRFVFD